MTMPQGSKGNRAKFKTAFSTAVGRVALDTLRQQRPAEYGALAARLDKSYSDTTNALAKYMLSTKYQNKWIAWATLKYFGQIIQLRNWQHKGTMKSAEVGAVSFGGRGGWKGEAAALIGEIGQKGYSAVLKGWETQLSKARGAEYLAIRDWKEGGVIKRLWGRRKIRRATAKIEVLMETCRKVRAVGEVMGYDDRF